MNAQKANELLKLAPHGLSEVIYVDAFVKGSGFKTQDSVFDNNTHAPENYPEMRNLIPDDPEAEIYGWWEFDERDSFDDDTLDDCKITIKYYPLGSDGKPDPDAEEIAEYSAWESEIWKRFEAGDGKPREQTGHTRSTTAEYRTVGETVKRGISGANGKLAAAKVEAERLNGERNGGQGKTKSAPER